MTASWNFANLRIDILSASRPQRFSQTQKNSEEAAGPGTELPDFPLENLYNRTVRRLLALAIAVLIVLPAISPLFALSGAGDPSRPACCRRDGKHHCMLVDMDGTASSSATRVTAVTVSERCPYGAKTIPGTTHPDWSLQTREAIFAGIVAHPSVAPQDESKRRISADRSRQKRGPPAQNS